MIPFVGTLPLCQVCFNREVPLQAIWLAPQSTDKGITIIWIQLCENCTEGWWDGSDWTGRFISLVPSNFIPEGFDNAH